VPEAKAQENFTDPDSRIMKRAGGGFDASYNAQTAVDDTDLDCGTIVDGPQKHRRSGRSHLPPHAGHRQRRGHRQRTARLRLDEFVPWQLGAVV